MQINENLEILVDKKLSTLWISIGSREEFYYSYKVLNNSYSMIKFLPDMVRKEKIKYIVFLSLNKTVWNMGGDLELFAKCVLTMQPEILKDYAYKCVEFVYNFNNSFETDAVTAFVIQGNAFGGGFESAISGNYTLAEESVKFSFPEVRFGIFPGMGAYSFLTRKVGYSKACEMIQSNKKYTSKELKDLKIINETCADGYGVDSMRKTIQSGKLEMMKQDKILELCSRIPKKELLAIADVWLEEVFQLTKDKLDFMMRVSDIQKTIVAKSSPLMAINL